MTRKSRRRLSAFGMFSQKQHLVDALRKKDIMLVLPEVFFDHWQQRTRLPRRQDVPPKYILDVDVLSDEQLQTLEVIAVSYCWVDASHPDPQCYHLQTLDCLLQKFVAGIFVDVQVVRLPRRPLVGHRGQGVWQWRWAPGGLVPRLDERLPAAAQRRRGRSVQACLAEHQPLVRPFFHDNVDAHVLAARCYARQLRGQRLDHLRAACCRTHLSCSAAA